MKYDESNRKTSKRKNLLKRLLIICAIVIGLSFVIDKAFDNAADKMESMSQEEKDEMEDKWDKFTEWVNE